VDNQTMEHSITERDKQNECVVCFDLERSHVCIPCGHLCLCINCAKTVNDTCPLCNTNCGDIIKVFR
ncbi:MAG: RING-HC finger protein, partial [bacterium]|nr:RING-HC finger protein [bacterium]